MGDLHPVQEALDLGDPAASGDRLEGERSALSRPSDGGATAPTGPSRQGHTVPGTGQLPMELGSSPASSYSRGSDDGGERGAGHGRGRELSGKEAQCPRGGGRALQIGASGCYTHGRGEAKREAGHRNGGFWEKSRKGCSLPPRPALLLRPRRLLLCQNTECLHQRPCQCSRVDLAGTGFRVPSHRSPLAAVPPQRRRLQSPRARTQSSAWPTAKGRRKARPSP